MLKGRKKLSNVNITDLGSTPVYSSTTENNGIIGYTEESPDYVIDADTPFYIIFGDHTKSMYISTNDFCVMDNVKVLVPNVYNKYAMQFVLVSWQKSIPTLGYSRHWSVAEKTVFKLPIDSNGEPDWLYMENYMRNIEVRVSTSISKLESAQGVENSKIDISNWGEFPLIELFDFYLSKGDNQAQKLDEGEIPLVSSGSFNNGICKYIDKGDGISELFEGNLITIDMFGQPFYQNNPFYSVSHGRVNILKPKFHINEYIGLFIVSVMQKMYYEKYGFATMCSQTKLKKECIKLPINSEGNPDWLYMENYMKALETKVGDFLNKTA